MESRSDASDTPLVAPQTDAAPVASDIASIHQHTEETDDGPNGQTSTSDAGMAHDNPQLEYTESSVGDEGSFLGIFAPLDAHDSQPGNGTDGPTLPPDTDAIRPALQEHASKPILADQAPQVEQPDEASQNSFFQRLNEEYSR